MNLKEIEHYLKNQNLDVRITRNARFMDQKCTPDVLSLVAESIQNYNEKFFSVRDIWNSDFSRKNVERFFQKPETSNKSLSNEYDKFFGQPIKLFEYAGIIKRSSQHTKKTPYYYEIVEKNLLDWIAISDKKSFDFLVLYLKEVLRQSDILILFDEFLLKENNNKYFSYLKKRYEDFIIENTPINGKLEVNRIFSKVLNPLAVDKNKAGTRRGRYSKTSILYDELLYNRINFRDKEKPKNISRFDFISQYQDDEIEKYNVEKAKRQVKRYQGEKSEIHPNIFGVANHAHHIFPQSSFREISDTLENLIIITAEEHMEFSHSNSSTTTISHGYQLVCLISKLNSLIESIFTRNDDFYSIESFLNILKIGLGITPPVCNNISIDNFNKINIFLANHFLNEIGKNKYNLSPNDLVYLIRTISICNNPSLDKNKISITNNIFGYDVFKTPNLSTKQALNKIVNLAIN